MIFHSLDFVAFFIAFVAVYWALPQRPQNILLLAGSYFFYGYVHPWFLILIASSTIIDYASARGMEQWPERKRLFMGLSIASNFGMLGFFKYFDFFVDKSQLPLMLREAKRAGLTLAFVRVQRRPAGGRPPYQSPALRRYITKLAAYIEREGGVFFDDTGDPAQTLDLYGDGDHLSHDGRRRYTQM